MPLFRYRVHGLTIDSDIALPELEAESTESAIDASVRTVEVLPHPGDGDVLLPIPGIADFLVQAGTRILVRPVPDVPDRNLRLYLLGSVTGALLHQRGLVPLHANAIAVDGRAIAFSGASGVGKSTLAAWASDHGYDILADDVSVIGDRDGTPVVLPGLRRLRLWRDALERSGRDVGAYPASYIATGEDDEPFDKFDLRLDDRAASGPLPLGAIAFLRTGPIAVRPMGAIEAADALFANTYRGHLVGEAGVPESHFRTCMALVERIPVLDITMPRDARRYDVIAGEILARVAAFIDGC